MLVQNYQSLRWNFDKLLSQASMNTYKKRFSEVVEILKIVSYEPAYHGIKEQNQIYNNFRLKTIQLPKAQNDLGPMWDIF